VIRLGKTKIEIGDRVIHEGFGEGTAVDRMGIESSKFKVDTVVECIKARDYNENVVGKRGKIIKNNNSFCYTVEFDEYIGGHAGEGWGACGKRGHCWNFSKETPHEYLKIITDKETKQTKFKEGDKVKVVRKVEKEWVWNLSGKMDATLGKVGTVRRAGSLYCFVLMDDERLCDSMGGTWSYDNECLELVEEETEIKIGDYIDKPKEEYGEYFDGNKIERRKEEMFEVSICENLDEIVTGVKGIKTLGRKKVKEELSEHQCEINRELTKKSRSINWEREKDEEIWYPTKYDVLEELEKIKKKQKENR